MALIPCPECDRQVSDQAPACPACGYPIAEARRPSPQILIHDKRKSERQGSGGNVVAALLSLLVPGLGQLTQGRLLDAFALFVVAVVLWFVLLGWVMNLAAAYDAATWDPAD